MSLKETRNIEVTYLFWQKRNKIPRFLGFCSPKRLLNVRKKLTVLR